MKWQNQCRFNFTGDLNYENKVNCLENYGFNRSAEFCTKNLEATSDKYRYPLQHKYECLADPRNSFPATELSAEVGICLNKYYDFQIERCLEAYELQFGVMGFNGPDP